MREHRTILVDFQHETTNVQLLGDGKAFLALVMAFILSLGLLRKPKATWRGGGCLTRHSHDVRVRLGVSLLQAQKQVSKVRIVLCSLSSL
jgi:hypothetical protein